MQNTTTSPVAVAINVTDYATTLVNAISRNDLVALRHILNTPGLNPDIPIASFRATTMDATALMYAAQQSRHECIPILLNAGADTERFLGKPRLTPLMLACQDIVKKPESEKLKTVFALLAGGANPNTSISNPHGGVNTALSFASGCKLSSGRYAKKYPTVVSALKAAGAKDTGRRSSLGSNRWFWFWYFVIVGGSYGGYQGNLFVNPDGSIQWFLVIPIGLTLLIYMLVALIQILIIVYKLFKRCGCL